MKKLLLGLRKLQIMEMWKLVIDWGYVMLKATAKITIIKRHSRGVCKLQDKDMRRLNMS